MAILTKIKTNPAHSADEIIVKHKGVRVHVSRETGNWHPDGKPWLACVNADQHYYANPDKWASGIGSFASSRMEAIIDAYDEAKANTLQFPNDWLREVAMAIAEEYSQQ